MSDIGLSPSLNGWDLRYQNDDYWFDASLRTSVVLSLVANARADDDEVDTSQDPRGWWANPQMGSKLWLLFRETINNSTITQVEEYIRESLQWMVDREIVVDPIQVSASRTAQNKISAIISIQRIDADEEVFIFNDLWSEIEGITRFDPAIDNPSIQPRQIETFYLLVNGNRLLVNGNPLELRG